MAASSRYPCGTSPETLYAPAMGVETQEEADRYLAELVQLIADSHRLTPAKAKEHALADLGYYAGCASHEARLRVERLFGAVHPLLGTAENGPPTPEQALAVGQLLALKHQNKPQH